MRVSDSTLVYRRDPDLGKFHPFTAIVAMGNLIYVGSSLGSIYVFGLAAGNFIKEIPYQESLFRRRRLGSEAESLSQRSFVQKINVNEQNILLTQFFDGSLIIFDQDQKQMLYSHQGHGSSRQILQIKCLPNTRCFFTLSHSELCVWDRQDQSSWQTRFVKLNPYLQASCFDFSTNFTQVMVAYTNGEIESFNLQTLEPKAFRDTLFSSTSGVHAKSIALSEENKALAVTCQDGTTLLLKKSPSNDYWLMITKLSEKASREAVEHQKVELLNTRFDDVIGALLLSRPNQIDLISVELLQDQAKKQVT